MPYTSEEKDWLEREWAFRAWGRAGLLSTDDYRQVLTWEAEAVPMEVVVSALNAFFDRREKREKPRTFVALKHLDRDVAKAVAQANQIAASVTASLNSEAGLPVPPVPPIPPLPNFGGKSIVGTLNGGGVDIKLTSMNGTITIRETK